MDPAFPTAGPLPPPEALTRFALDDPDASPHGFELLLPAGWSNAYFAPTVEPAQDGPPRQLAAFVKAGRQARIDVCAAVISREINPADWLTLTLRAAGHDVRKTRRGPGPAGDVADVLSVVPRPGGAVVARSLALKDGARIALVQAAAAEADYPALAEDFRVAVATFRLTGVLGLRYAETMNTWSAEAPVACRFLAPLSWTQMDMERPPDGGSGFHLLHEIDGRLLGQIAFGAFPPDAAPDHRELFRRVGTVVCAAGVVPAEGAWTGRTAEDGVSGVWTAAVAGSRAGPPGGTTGAAPVDMRLVASRTPEAWFAFVLFGPGPEQAPWVHAVNARALQVAVETLGPTPDDPGGADEESVEDETDYLTV